MTNGIIYKYTSPSGKVYIGKTINEKRRRYSFYNLNRRYAGPKIERARKKYGPKNFKYEVIFKVSSHIQAAVELGYSKGNFNTYCNGRNNHKYKGFLYYKGPHDFKIK